MINLQQNDTHDSTLSDLTIDLTPMLDILFILLVFFIITAGSVFQSLDLTLPSSVAEELSIINKPKHILLEISQNSYAIDGKNINNFATLKQLIPDTIKAKPKHELIIASDKNIPIEKLLKVLTYLQSQGIEAANILMKKENNK